jgi:hypothetical protein
MNNNIETARENSLRESDDDDENHTATSLDDDGDDGDNLDMDTNAGQGRGLMEGASITFDKNSVLLVDSASASQSSTTKKNEDSAEDKDEKLKRRMEINRLRAKDIRKRKKRMIEDMHNQIFQLTLENNKLRTQTEVQQTQIDILRQRLANATGDVLTSTGDSNNLQLHQQQQQQVRPQVLLQYTYFFIFQCSPKYLYRLFLPFIVLSLLAAGTF